MHFDSYPIEVAVRVMDQVYSWLIKPEASWQYWCDKAESLHGITRAMLQREGKSASVVATELVRLLEDTNGLLYSDAADWDADWINTLFFAADEFMPFHIVSIYDLMDSEQSRHFDNAKARLAETGEYRLHRAADDVRIIGQAYGETIR